MVILVLKIYKYWKKVLLKVSSKESPMKYKSRDSMKYKNAEFPSTLKHYFLDWQYIPLKTSWANILWDWELCQNNQKTLVQLLHLQLQNNINTDSIFLNIVSRTGINKFVLEKKTCNVNKSILTDLILYWTYVKRAILR